ncbi:YveK family protein [Alkalihalobacillus sp. CinArs1]|uniref:YveK family protein n=1 Tax=Alkalihalobacillus sp. CinArs1 TaxID=2995314 RepID=UPI0022DDB411|nr:Wzz/FepE/Etk N-terminal domain-containing protein [Alkalihalobacillus sp. CinArs1]
MEETINLKEVLGVLKKRIFMIISLVILSAVVSAVLSLYFLTPTYEASTQILVHQSNKDTQVDGNQLQTDLDLINTYNVIIKSPLILNEVIKKMNLDLTPQELNAQIEVANAEESQVVEIFVQDSERDKAMQIANEIVSVFQAEISTIMNVNNVSVLSSAQESTSLEPISPQPVINVGIALVLGLAFSIALAFFLEYMDNSIKTDKDIDEVLGVPTLGIINYNEPKKLMQVQSNVKKVKSGGNAIGS